MYEFDGHFINTTFGNVENVFHTTDLPTYELADLKPYVTQYPRRSLELGTFDTNPYGNVFVIPNVNLSDELPFSFAFWFKYTGTTSQMNNGVGLFSQYDTTQTNKHFRIYFQISISS